MHEYICGVSAFRLHRIPPQVLACCVGLPDLSLRSDRYLLSSHPELLGSVGAPLHVLTLGRQQQRSSKTISRHLWSGELPSGSFEENELGATVATPAFTLLTMAPSVSDVHLLMAAYELCGEFAVYRPSEVIQRELDRMPEPPGSATSMWWSQVRRANGSPSDLWRRPALTTPDELLRFARRAKGARGQRKLLWAAERVSGAAASPLEVQASIKLGLSRRYGGEGLGPFANNQRIPLSPSARRLAAQETCYADIFFEASETHGPLSIECHGHMVHDEQTKGGLDANRTTALQSMGIEVVLLTQEQMTDPSRWAAAVGLIAAKLGTTRRPKTEALQEREAELNRQLFIDWRTLGA